MALWGVYITHGLFFFCSTSFLIMESNCSTLCFPGTSEAYKSPLQQLEELKALGARFYCLSSMNGSLKAPMIIAHSRALHRT